MARGRAGHFRPRRIKLEELREHLHVVEDQPEAVPYRTSYYEENWGFCLSKKQQNALVDEEYEIAIDSSLCDGALSYGELLIEGERDDEVLISVHICHPSLANDNLPGVVVAVQLAQRLAKTTPRHSYRFLFVPGTIGAITWLARNAGAVKRGHHGEFPEYHTSQDDLAFVHADMLEHAYEMLVRVSHVNDANRRYVNLAPYGEPQLGRRGLYRAMGGEASPANLSIVMLWLLQLADGEHDLLAIAERSDMAWEDLCRAAQLPVEHKLLAEAHPEVEAP